MSIPPASVRRPIRRRNAMRFMMMIKSDAQAEAGVLPDQEILEAMGKYNQELLNAGVMMAGEGLKASSHGVRVRSARGKVSVLDGPFAEAKELVAGFWLLQTKTKQEAVEWAKRCPSPASLELRQLYE